MSKNGQMEFLILNIPWAVTFCWSQQPHSCHENQPQPSYSKYQLWYLAAQPAFTQVWGFYVWLIVFWWAGRIRLSHQFIYFWLPLHCFQLVRSGCVSWVCCRRMIIINPSQTGQMQPAIPWLLRIHLCLHTLLGTGREVYTAVYCINSYF